MSLTVLVTEDFDRMSEIAGRILVPKMRMATIEGKVAFNLGLATGNSPTGLYQRIAEKQKEFDAARVTSWNLDEYVGLPGEHASARLMHREGYAYFMIHQLFGKLNPGFAATFVPAGTEVEQGKLEREITNSFLPHEVFLDGTSNGKAVVIPPHCSNPYLNWIRERLLVPYISSIEAAGGIDWWVVGSGEKGHIGFHESGIPLEYEMLLVKLDDNTIENAVKDGHFTSVDKSPRYAISMGAKGVVNYSRNVLLLAYGGRKTNAIAKSLLDTESADVPISILQRYIPEQDRQAIYVLEQSAALGILGKEKQLAEKGIIVRDLRVG
jgi:glucosamine-6-phosphate deaminase